MDSDENILNMVFGLDKYEHRNSYSLEETFGDIGSSDDDDGISSDEEEEEAGVSDDNDDSSDEISEDTSDGEDEMDDDTEKDDSEMEDTSTDDSETDDLAETDEGTTDDDTEEEAMDGDEPTEDAEEEVDWSKKVLDLMKDELKLKKINTKLYLNNLINDIIGDIYRKIDSFNKLEGDNFSNAVEKLENLIVEIRLIKENIYVSGIENIKLELSIATKMYSVIIENM